MLALALIIHIFLGSTLAGAATVVVLSANIDSVGVLLGAAAAGFLGAAPLSWLIAKRLTNNS